MADTTQKGRRPRRQFDDDVQSQAVRLVVDGARMPVNVVTPSRSTIGIVPTVSMATVGVVVGTLLGHRLLGRIPEARSRPVLATILGILGAAMVIKGARS